MSPGRMTRATATTRWPGRQGLGRLDAEGAEELIGDVAEVDGAGGEGRFGAMLEQAEPVDGGAADGLGGGGAVADMFDNGAGEFVVLEDDAVGHEDGVSLGAADTVGTADQFGADLTAGGTDGGEFGVDAAGGRVS
jgi:hypothetical protein